MEILKCHILLSHIQGYRRVPYLNSSFYITEIIMIIIVIIN